MYTFRATPQQLHSNDEELPTTYFTVSLRNKQIMVQGSMGLTHSMQTRGPSTYISSTQEDGSYGDNKPPVGVAHNVK